MASLSNINGLFDVHSTGAIQFNGNHGTAGQILRSNGNAAPTWVAASTVIGGPYLPLTGGTLSGATATATGISFTVGGTLTGTSATFSGLVSGITPTAAANFATKAYVDAHPGSGGTVTSVATGNGLTGGTITTTGTLTMSGAYSGSMQFSGAHGSSQVGCQLPAANNGANTGVVNLRMWCSEPGITWDWAGFGYNVTNDNGNPNGFGRLNTAFGQAYQRYSSSGDMYFYNTNTAGARVTTLTLNSNGQATFGYTVTAPTFVGALTGNATTASSAAQVTINYNNNSNANYQMLWGSGNNVYGTAGVVVNALSNTVTATTFSGSLSGNANTSTTFSTGRTNYKGVTDAAVIGQMMWKNYGNNHTIFDASSGTSPQGNVISNTNSINAWTAAYPTLMGWNGSSTYGVRVDSARIADSAANQGNYLLLTGGTISGTLTTNGQITANSTLYLKDRITLPASGLSSVSGRPAYAIYQEGGAWTHPYPDLCISMHTGIKFGANAGYNGMRFYDDYTMATQVMSINNSSDGLGAGNVYINNSLQVGNSLTATTFIGALTGNATSATNVGGLTPNMIVSGGSGGRKSTRVYSFAGTSEPSGFYYGSNIANNPPTTDWINYIQSAGDSWTSGNNYSFQLTHAFHSDNFWVSRTTNGSQSTARLVLDGGGSSQTKSGALASGTSMTAPVFYDTNTSYYGNFASTSVLNALQFNYTQHSANNIRMGNSTTMNAISSGSNNAAFGVEALGGCSTGSRNFAYGYAALYSLSSGGSNIAMGDATGYNVTSGSNNLLFGQNAGRTGYQSPQSIAGVTSGSNQIHMGNESHSTARIQISWTVNSDSRDKTDITPIDVGLDFVKDLNPVTFRWDKRSDYEDRVPTGQNKLEELTLGFLAQEVEEVEKSYGYDVANKTNLVVDRDVDQDHFGITYEKMIPILTKAIQELEARVKELENK